PPLPCMPRAPPPRALTAPVARRVAYLPPVGRGRSRPPLDLRLVPRQRRVRHGAAGSRRSLQQLQGVPRRGGEPAGAPRSVRRPPRPALRLLQVQPHVRAAVRPLCGAAIRAGAPDLESPQLPAALVRRAAPAPRPPGDTGPGARLSGSAVRDAVH